MTTQLSDPTPTNQANKRPKDARGRVITGIALILIGALALLGQVTQSTQLALLAPAGLGVIFLAWGLITHSFGLLVPGGILLGIGLGAYLITGPYSNLESDTQGGLFMLAFAGGWFLISLFSPLTTQRFQWWPLIPGTIIGAVGLALLGGGMALQLLQIVGYGWPLILVGIGIYLLVRRRA